MNVMTLHLLHSSGSERFDGVTSFVGEDASGSFGILPGHAGMMTALSIGLARFRIGTEDWHYLALPGGILTARGGGVTICSHRYLHDSDFHRMGALLTDLMNSEEESLGSIRHTLHRLEEEMLRRLRDIGRRSES